MPIKKYDKYFGGKGGATKAHAAMLSEYGPKKGEQVFYATKNRNKNKMHDGGTVNGDNYELQAGELIQPPMSEFAPEMTDHPFAPNPFLNNDVLEDSPEHIRQKNNRSRDCRNGYKITDNKVYPSS